jgi:hypothetical protein
MKRTQDQDQGEEEGEEEEHVRCRIVAAICYYNHLRLRKHLTLDRNQTAGESLQALL